MSYLNANFTNLDARYSKPTDVASAISAQASIDAGIYANNAIILPANLFTVTTSSGGYPLNLNEANGHPYWAFKSGSDGRISASIRVPATWQSFAVDLVWFNASPGTGTVKWRLDAQFYNVGDTLNNVSVVASTATAGNVDQVAVCTLAPNVTAPIGAFYTVGIVREGSATSTDTKSGNVGLLHVVLRRVT